MGKDKKCHGRGDSAIREDRKRTPLVAPRRSTLPDLSPLRHPLAPRQALYEAFAGKGPRTYLARAFSRTFVRIVDKTVDDYERARLTFEAYTGRIQNDVLHLLLVTTGYMENCVGSVYRAQRFARRLQQDPEIGCAIPTLGVMTSDATTRISILRTGIEHLDTRFIEGRIEEGDLNALWMDEEFMELEDARVDYRELAIWITELNRLANDLCDFTPPEERAAPACERP